MVQSRIWVLGALMLGVVATVMAEGGAPTFLPNLFPFPNSTGILKTFSATGNLDLTGPFFRVSVPMGVVAQPATNLVTLGPSRPHTSPNGLKKRRGWIRSFAPMTARIAITISTRLQRKAGGRLTAC